MKRLFFLIGIVAVSMGIRAAAATSGTCGANLQWTYRASDSTLIITGSGPMQDFTYDYYRHPWSPYNLHISHIVLPEGLTRIGEYGLCYCREVTELRVPDSVIEIAQYGMNSMSGLKKLTLGANLRWVGEASMVAIHVDTLISTASFDTWCRMEVSDQGGNIEVNHLLIVDGTPVTGDFYIPNTVHVIRDGAFYCCPGMTSLHIPASVDTIGELVGTFVYSTDQFYYEGTLEQWCRMVRTSHLCFHTHYLYINGTDMSNVVLPAGMTRVGDYTFRGVKNLRNLTLPASLDTVGLEAFQASGVTSISGGQNIRRFEKHCFSLCDLHSFAIPRGTKYIGDYAFWTLEDWRGTIRLDSVEYLGEDAFAGCAVIDSLILPDGLTTIGRFSFFNCYSLRYVHLPSSLREIPDGCFQGDWALRSITIPATVTRIGGWAFDETSISQLDLPEVLSSLGQCALQCDSLRLVRIPCLTPPMTEGAVGFSKTQIQVPCQAIGDYRQAPNWSDHTNYITDPYIGTSSFGSTNSSLGTVSIEQDCAEITLTATVKAENYHFSRWSNGETANPYSFTQVCDTVVNAIFELDRKRITWRNSDGSVLLIDSVPYYSIPVYPGIPQHPTDTVHFRFYDWDRDRKMVTCDTTYTALYTDVRLKYEGLCLHAFCASTVLVYRISWGTYGAQYSRDGQNWRSLGSYNLVSIPAGDSIFVRGTGDNTEYFNGYFRIQGGVMASGSVMSLIDTTLTRTDVPEGAFEKLFVNCTALYTAPELPATAVGKNGYYRMFYGCTNLVAAPELPATTLGANAYQEMFSGCSSLRYVEMPASPVALEDTVSPGWLTGTVDTCLRVVVDSTLYPVRAAADHGRVWGTGKYRNGYPATLAVIPDAGYTFLAWHTGSTANPLRVTAAANSSSILYAFCPPTNAPLSDSTNVLIQADAALICWPMVSGATSYLLTLYADSMAVEQQVLDLYGQPIEAPDTTVAYAPLRAAASPVVLRYYWDGLEGDVRYGYTIEAYNDTTLLETIHGEFTLAGGFIPDIPQGWLDTVGSEPTARKVLIGSEVFILYKGHRYGILGSVK